MLLRCGEGQEVSKGFTEGEEAEEKSGSEHYVYNITSKQAQIL